MNFFEQQLRNIFNGSEHSNDIKYIGRSCYIPLDEATKVKATFISTLITGCVTAWCFALLSGHGKQYDSAKIKNEKLSLAVELLCRNGNVPAYHSAAKLQIKEKNNV